MEKFNRIQTRCLDMKRMTKDLCERLMQNMVIEGFLVEEPKVNSLKYSELCNYFCLFIVTV